MKKISEKAKAASRKTRTKTSANVLLHVNTNSEVNSYKVRKKKRFPYRHKLPKHDCKTKCKETIKRGWLPNAEDVYKVWSSENRKKTNTDQLVSASKNENQKEKFATTINIKQISY